MNRKKIVWIAVAIPALLLLLMVASPFLFKDRIIGQVKKMANERLNATLDFKKAEISLFRSFPQLDISLEEITLTGTREFENTPLLHIGKLGTSVALNSLWNSGGMVIKDILIDKGDLQLVINQAGKANWDIFKPSAAASSSASKAGSQVDLEKIEILGSNLSYNDQQANLSWQAKGANFTLAGFLRGSNSKLDFKGRADSIDISYGGNRLLQSGSLTAEGGLQANFDKLSFRLLDNKFTLNHLPVEVRGTWETGEKSDQADLTISSRDATLENLFGFLPASLQQKLKNTETAGKVAFNAKINGTWSDDTYPAIQADLKLGDGMVKFNGKPGQISGILIDAAIRKPQGSIDSLAMEIKKMEAFVAGHQVIGDLKLTTPVSKPVLSGEIVGEVDCNTLRQVFPLDSLEMSGMARANIHFGGPVSAVSSGEYDKFQTQGNFSLRNFAYKSPLLPDRLGIQTADFIFNSREITISSMQGKLGQSDFQMDGRLSDYWAYLLKNGTLNGDIRFKSGLLDVTRLMNGYGGGKDTTQSTPFVVPQRINLTVQANVGKMMYNRLDITETTGKLVISDQKLNLEQLSMNLLKGKLVLSGLYTCQEKMPADFNFKVDIRDFDLPSAYQSLGMVRQFLPFAGNSRGTILSGLSLTGKLGNDYAPDFSVLNGTGQVSLKNVELVGTKMFEEVGKYFRKDLFTNVKVNDFASSIAITNGALAISPFTTKIANQEVTISGNQSLGLDLNYRLDFKVNKNDMSPDVTGLIGFVPGVENIEKFPIRINVGGKLAKPQVGVDLSEAKSLVESEFAKKTKTSIQEVVKKLGLENLFK